MVRSRPRFAAALAGLAFVVVQCPAPATGQDSEANLPSSYFQLKNISNEPGRTPISIESVAALVLPPGSVIPDNPEESPLNVLPGSSGFDESNLQVLLGEGLRDGLPVQALGLDFGPGGFQPGAVLNFDLDIQPEDTKINLTPELVVPEEAKDSIFLTAIHPVPEPGSIALWVVGTLAAGWYARRRLVGMRS